MQAARLALAALSLIPACSFVTVTSPTPKPANAPAGYAVPKCTTSRAAPALDAIVAGVSILGGLSLAGRSENEDHEDTDYYGDGHLAGEFGAALILTGLAFGASAIYGFAATGRCQELYMTTPRPSFAAFK